MKVTYWDEKIVRLILKSINDRRAELLDQLAVGVPYETYIKQVGHIAGLEEACLIVSAVMDRLNGPENE
jgi:hypothetical protein